jgi:hypothetical protein
MGEPGTGMRVADPVEHPFVVLEQTGADAAGEHDDVGLGQILEGGVDADPEHAVVASHLSLCMADEGDVEPRDALEHLVRPDAVERGEPWEERDRNCQAVGHAGVPSRATTRNRRL